MKERKKVLIFIDWYLPGFKAGGPIRSCANLVSYLKQDYQFYIVTRNTDYTSTIPYTTVTTDAWNTVDGAQVYYISRQSLKSRNLRMLLEEVEPDVVYVNGIYSFYFSILPIVLAKQLGHKNILVAGRGMLAQSAIHVKSAKKKLFFKLAKFYKLYRGVTFHATNHAEAADIREVLGIHVPVKIAPNLPEFSLTFTQPIATRPKIPGELKLVSIARISPEKNLKFALELLLTFKLQANIRFDLYGPIYNELYWQECQALMMQMPDNVAVNYKGSLDKERVHETLQQYHALFMPTKGENFGHVIVESFTAGCAALISDQTPWKMLAEKGIGYDLPLTNHAAFHDMLVELVQLDQQQFDALSDRALQFAKAYCQNESLLKSNKALFDFE